MSSMLKINQGPEMTAAIKDTPKKQGELDRDRVFFQTLRNLLEARERPQKCSLVL